MVVESYLPVRKLVCPDVRLARRRQRRAVVAVDSNLPVSMQPRALGVRSINVRAAIEAATRASGYSNQPAFSPYSAPLPHSTILGVLRQWGCGREVCGRIGTSTAVRAAIEAATRVRGYSN
jgi:hypothetical protein